MTVQPFGDQLPLFANRNVSTGERARLVLALLKDGCWHSTAEISSPEWGGTEGTRRLRELRARGCDIEKRRAPGSDQFEYRLRGSPL